MAAARTIPCRACARASLPDPGSRRRCDDCGRLRLGFVPSAARPSAGRGDDGSIDQADPVMSADTNLDFRVSLAEFLAQARRVYARLDAGADGRLTRMAAVERACGDDRGESREE